MNKEIKPTYVTFEQAKWLKEKGFDVPCKQRFWVGFEGEEHFQDDCISNNWNDYDDSSTVYYSASEQWQVVEWLFLKHRLDIIVKYPESNTNKIEGINSVYYDLEIYKLQGGDAYKVYKFIGISDKKQVAYSAAFDYILNNNLI
jgi:hypothetical protein